MRSVDRGLWPHKVGIAYSACYIAEPFKVKIQFFYLLILYLDFLVWSISRNSMFSNMAFGSHFSNLIYWIWIWDLNFQLNAFGVKISNGSVPGFILIGVGHQAHDTLKIDSSLSTYFTSKIHRDLLSLRKLLDLITYLARKCIPYLYLR